MNAPTNLILERLAKGEVIPFLGAGASLGGNGDPWVTESNVFPTSQELAKHLALKAEMDGVGQETFLNLARTASYFEMVADRSLLRKELHAVFARQIKPGSLHRFFAGQKANMLLVTTNFDDLLEQAFDEAKRPYDLLIYPADQRAYANSVLWWKHEASEPTFCSPDRLDINIDERSVIYKLHGSICRSNPALDNYVITEEDYVEFLSRMVDQSAIPPVLLDWFRPRHFLFLGYSLSDWNFRVLLRRLSDTASVPQDGHTDKSRDEVCSWGIQRSVDAFEKMLWSKKQIKLFERDISDFVKALVNGGKMS